MLAGQCFGYFCCHALRFGKMFGSDVCRLEALAVVPSFLYMSDRRAEQGRAVLLRHRKQGDFTVKLDELFDYQFLSSGPFATDWPLPDEDIKGLMTQGKPIFSAASFNSSNDLA